MFNAFTVCAFSLRQRLQFNCSCISCIAKLLAQNYFIQCFFFSKKEAFYAKRNVKRAINSPEYIYVASTNYSLMVQSKNRRVVFPPHYRCPRMFRHASNEWNAAKRLRCFAWRCVPGRVALYGTLCSAALYQSIKLMTSSLQKLHLLPTSSSSPPISITSLYPGTQEIPGLAAHSFSHVVI